MLLYGRLLFYGFLGGLYFLFGIENDFFDDYFVNGRDVGVHKVVIGGVVFSEKENFTTRSEERRVGKECRSRWSPYH